MVDDGRLKLGIVGFGYVGKAFVEMVKSHYDVVVFDPAFSEKDNFDNVSFKGSVAELEGCALGVVCVPTPAHESGECDVSLVEASAKDLPTDIILVKSTISPGTCDRLSKETGKQLVFSPEYVGESKYYNPHFGTKMVETPFVILGGEKGAVAEVHDLLLPILGPTKKYFTTSSLNAELIKYMENLYFASKVTFMNEMYGVAEVFGADWAEVREGWLLDPRVESMHTAVFKRDRGFAGKCYPKDLAALIEASKKAGYNPEFLNEVEKSNRRFRDMNE